MTFDHRIHHELLSDNIRLEVRLETSPIYSGDYCQLLLRLRHLGSEDELKRLEQLIKENDCKLQDLKNTYSERLFSVGLHEKIDDIKKLNSNRFFSFLKSENPQDREIQTQWNSLQSERAQLQGDLDFHKPVQMVSGELHMTGIFKFSKLAIDSTKLEKASKLPSLFYAEDYMPKKEGTLSETDIIPFFLVPQSLIFTEKTLTAGSVCSFKIKSQTPLPTDLPASYIAISNNFSIAYHLCLDIFALDNQTGLPLQFPLKIPLFVYPFFDDEGKQKVCKLDGEIRITEPFVVKKIIDREEEHLSLLHSNESIKPSHPNGKLENNNEGISSPSHSHPDEESVNMQQRKAVGLLKADFKELADQIDPTSYDEDELISKMLKKQKDKTLAESFSSKLNITANDTKMNVANIKNHSKNFQKVVPYLNSLENLTYKQEYMINRNAENIVKITLNKLVYQTSDDINLSLDFARSEKFKVTSVLGVFESHEIINPHYSILENDSSSKDKKQGFPIYENHSTMFDETTSLSMRFIPYSFNNFNIIPSLFKNNIFQHKYLIKIKLVLVDKSEHFLVPGTKEDKYGKSWKAASTLDGESIQFYIPVLVLPS
ncbi:hypothetical protein ACO0RG_002543 [Hanseniaspora osmophila]